MNKRANARNANTHYKNEIRSTEYKLLVFMIVATTRMHKLFAVQFK